MPGNIVENIKFNDTVYPTEETHQDGWMKEHKSFYKHTTISQEPEVTELLNKSNSQEVKEEIEEKTNMVSEKSDNKNIIEENAQTIEKLKALADEQNDVKAMNALAVIYFYSADTNSQSLKYFEKASNLGYPAAHRNLAIMLEISANPDYNKIIDLYKKSAQKNDAMAINNLGCCYMSGDGIEVNYQKAVKCFEKASSLNDELAKINLANCMSLGLGIKSDLTKAFQLYNQAAELGNPLALRMVADCHLNGTGTEQNLQKAIDCYKLAVNAGDIKSREILSHLNNRSVANKHDMISLDKQIETAKKIINNANAKSVKNISEEKEKIHTKEKGGKSR